MKSNFSTNQSTFFVEHPRLQDLRNLPFVQILTCPRCGATVEFKVGAVFWTNYKCNWSCKWWNQCGTWENCDSWCLLNVNHSFSDEFGTQAAFSWICETTTTLRTDAGIESNYWDRPAKLLDQHTWLKWLNINLNFTRLKVKPNHLSPSESPTKPNKNKHETKLGRSQIKMKQINPNPSGIRKDSNLDWNWNHPKRSGNQRIQMETTTQLNRIQFEWTTQRQSKI